jgi:hypothetical protein
VQSPSGASERIFAPHFRQTLITLAMSAGPSASYARTTAIRWRSSSPISPGVATV